LSGPEDNWICDKDVWVSHGKPSYPKPENPCGNKITLPKTKEDCLSANGIWKKQGLAPTEMCNLKTQDRGTICHDSSECQGICQASLTREEIDYGMRGKILDNKKSGQCSVWIKEYGCMGIMKNSKASVICFD